MKENAKIEKSDIWMKQQILYWMDFLISLPYIIEISKQILNLRNRLQIVTDNLYLQLSFAFKTFNNGSWLNLTQLRKKFTKLTNSLETILQIKRKYYKIFGKVERKFLTLSFYRLWQEWINERIEKFWPLTQCFLRKMKETYGWRGGGVLDLEKIISCNFNFGEYDEHDKHQIWKLEI